jgi:hypothetical protein
MDFDWLNVLMIKIFLPMREKKISEIINDVKEDQLRKNKLVFRA